MQGKINNKDTRYNRIPPIGVDAVAGAE